MTRITGLLLTLSAACAVGCEQVVDLDGNAPAQIVVESRLKAGDVVRVDVRVLDSFGRPASSEGLEQSTGTVAGSDGREGALYITDVTDSTASLALDSLIISEGVTYTLELQAPGFAPLLSTTRVPASATLGKLAALSYPRDSVSNQTIELPISFMDPVGEDSYFHLLISIEEAGTLAPNDLSHRPRVAALLHASQSFGSSTAAWFFSDLGFRDGRFEGKVALDVADIAQFAHPHAVVELRTVSQAYFNYFEVRDRSAASLPVKSTESVVDNVVGGSGVFGSYSSSVVRYSLSK